MAAGRIRGITIEIGANTTALTKALASVDRALSKTQTNLRDLNKALKLDPTNTNLLKDRQKELSRAIEETESKLKTEQDAYAELSKADKTKENVEKMRQLKVQIDLDKVALQELKEEAKSAASVLGSQMQAAGDKIKEVGDKIKVVGDKITGIGQTMTQKVTVPIVAAFGGSIKAAMDWESAFTGVMKTVDETANTTYDDLKAGINQLAETTASSQNEIAAVMEIAGQLGVSADDITDFTETVIKLKDTTNMTADEAASDIAKFANVTKMSLDDIDKFGAAIVDLGNNYATTEADIMSMAMRLAGAGSQVGLSQGEILGLATALSSVGIEAEMGGSAFSKAMIKMQVAVETGFDQVNDVTQRAGMSLRDLELMSTNDTKSFKELAQSLGMTTTEIKEVITNGNNLANFADVAGTSTEEFVKLYRDDAPAALQAFIKGLGDTDAKGESTIAMLQDMGFTEVRLRDTLTRLANSQGLVTDAMSQGNEAWKENAALDAEAEKRYATMESQLSQLKARFTEVAVSIGEILMPYVSQLMDFIQGLIDKWNGLDESQQKMIIKIAAIAAAVGPVLIVIGSVITAVSRIVWAVGEVTKGIGILMTFLSGLGAPILIVIGLIGALIAAFVYFYNTNEEFRDKVNAVIEQIKIAFQGFVENVKVWLDQVVAWFAPIVDSIRTYLEAIWGLVVEIVGEIITTVKTYLATHATEINAAITTIKTIIESALIFIQGFVTTKLNVMKSIFTGVLNIMANLIKAFTSLLKGDWKSAMDYLKNAAQSAVTMVKNIFINLRDGITETFEKLIEKFRTWGEDMIENLVGGIKDKYEAVKDTIKGVAGVISSYLHFSEPDVGPLANFSSYAPDMMKLFAKGITDNSGLITDAIQKSFNLRPVINNSMLTNGSINNAATGMTSNQPISVNVTLQGDANMLFKVVKAEAVRTHQITGIAYQV